MFFTRTRVSPIGVSLEQNAVRLLQLEHKGSEWRVRASAEIDRGDAEGAPLDRSLAKKIEEALRTNPFVGRRSVVALPSDAIVERHVKVESAEGQALCDQLLFELEPSFPNDVPIVQHLAVGEVQERGERRHELIVLAASLRGVESLLEFLESADLEPIALDAESCAIVRCFMHRRRRKADAERQTAIVHVGQRATWMTITSAMHPMFMKQLPLGAMELLDAASARLGLGRDEIRICPASDRIDEEKELGDHVAQALRLQLDSLALELGSCLRYHAASRRGSGPLEILLVGPGAEIPGVADSLAEALGEPVSRPDPFCAAYSGVPSDRRTATHFPLWCVPLGLALREDAA